jgi:FkbM family methyltransferase
MTLVRSLPAQAVHDVLMRVPYRGPLSRAVLKAAHLVRRRMVAGGDPLVTARIGGVPLLVPLSHKFPLDRKAFPSYSANTPRIAAQVWRKHPDMTFIDVGANVGDTVALLREATRFPILGVEAEPRFLALLRANVQQFPEVECAPVYLGESLQILRGQAVTRNGTSRLETGGDAPAITVTTLDELVKDHPRFAAAAMVKIDTDGFDARIIRGGAAWLASRRPVLFFEYDPRLLALQNEDPPALLDFLAGLGYRRLLVYEEMGGFIESITLPDADAARRITARFSGEPGRPYCDLCAFGPDDEDVHDAVVAAERTGARP